MKKITSILIIAILVVCMSTLFTGCTTESEESKPDLSSRFEMIDTCTIKGDSITIYYDTETLVMYQYFDGYKSGGLSVMYNADGTVMLYNKHR